MPIQTTFTELVNQLSVSLKANGFKKTANFFHRLTAGNWAVIAFQKSRNSSSREIFFTINLGVCSGEIRQFFNPELARQKPIIADCHWKTRLPEFFAKGQDKWWSLDQDTNLTALVTEIETLLANHALPALAQLITDEALLSFWQTNFMDGFYSPEKVQLAILYKKFGKITELMVLLAQLEKQTAGKATAFYFCGVRNLLLAEL